MKKTILLVICVLSVIKSYSQVNIGKSKSPINLYVSSLDKTEFELVKTSTTYFIIPSQLNYDEVQKKIEEIWTFNKIVFKSQEEFEKNENDFMATGNSVIRLIDNNYEKVKTNLDTGSSRTVMEYIDFRFGMYYYLKVEKNKRGKIKKDVFIVAEIFFTPSIKYRSDLVAGSSRQSLFMMSKLLGKEKDIDKTNIEEPNFYNFNLGYIKNYFQTLNDRLLKNENFNIRDGYINKIKVKDLKDEVLFAPDWILKKYNPIKADLKEIVKPDEIFNKYQFEYKIIPNEELNTKILAGEEFYYLMYTQFNRVKIISIIHSLTGEIIYLIEDKSYNIKDSDLKKISKLIE